MAQRRATYGNQVETPNGPATPIAQWFNPADPNGLYYLVRHRKGAHIDLENGAARCSETNISGWLVVYRKEEIAG